MVALPTVVDLGGGLKRIEGKTIAFRTSSFMSPGALRMQDSTIEGIDYEIYTRDEDISIRQVVIVLRQFEIQRNRMPVDLLQEIQFYYMKHGELPPGAL